MAGKEQVATVPLPELEPGKSESWVQILPAGTFDLTDHRGPWIVKDMASVIAASRNDLKRGMPVDMDHALDRHNRAEAPAAGWIEELAARENGIWARIAWTPTGKSKIEGREYRFISPVLMVTKAGEVMAIKRAGLTNAPATAMKALCSEEDRSAEEGALNEAAIVAMLREALAAPADMSVSEMIKRARTIIAAAETTRTDNAPAKELASSYMNLLVEVHEGKIEAALERCRDAGKVVPANEEWAYELASRDLSLFERWEAGAPAIVSLGGPRLAGRTPPPLDQGRFRGNTERMAVCSQLGLYPDQIEDKE